MEFVFAVLLWRRIQVRNGICPVTLPSGRWKEVDLRLRFRGRVTLCELKVAGDLRKARRLAFGRGPGYAEPEELQALRSAAAGGTWRGPHPSPTRPDGTPKESNARFVAALAVGGARWEMRVYRRGTAGFGNHIARFDGQLHPGRASGGARRVAALAKAAAAPKAKAKAKAKAAAQPPIVNEAHSAGSDDSDSTTE